MAAPVATLWPPLRDSAEKSRTSVPDHAHGNSDAIFSCECTDPVQRSKSSRSGKEGFAVEKPNLEKGHLSQKISLQGTTGKRRFSGSSRPFLGWRELGFFDPEIIFSRYAGS